MTDSQPGTRPQSRKPSTIRLVIRAEILPDKPAPASAPPRVSWRVWAGVLGAIAAVAIVGIGIFIFGSAPEDTALESAKAEPPVAADVGVKEPSPEPATSASSSSQAADASIRKGTPTTVVKEVLPNPSQGALQTIRGTVRVSIRVTIDSQGAVKAAVPEDAGPSRYFERLSLEAARQWTFTPTDDTGPRSRLLRFHFTPQGATAFVDD